MKNKKNLYDIKFKKITSNSKDVKKGDLFIALKGTRYDGQDFVKEAFSKGATAAVVAARPSTRLGVDKNKLIYVEDTRKTLSSMAARYYKYPSRKLNVIGITGTNGKTTTSFLLDKIFRDTGFKTGLIGTIVYKIGKRCIQADRTTPDALRLNYLLNRMAAISLDYAILEISSHALEQKRVDDIFYDVALFTNLTPEHLDYHRNMNDYFKAKAKIFDNLKDNGVAVLNKDDSRTKTLIKDIPRKILTYGLNSKADMMVSRITSDINGSRFNVLTPYGKININTRLLGLHNISNILAAISVASIYNLSLKKIKESIESFDFVPGRLQMIDEGQNFSVFVDYAHTPDALCKVLLALKEYAKKRIITVFGCGGQRDRSKRPQMGRIATELSDYTVITNDNPRTESPKIIIRDIKKGIKSKSAKYSIIMNRKEAIKTALDMARKGDTVLIAGKGHEAVQIVGENHIKFDDYLVAKGLLKRNRYVY